MRYAQSRGLCQGQLYLRQMFLPLQMRSFFNNRLDFKANQTLALREQRKLLRVGLSISARVRKPHRITAPERPKAPA